jgi:hypothetical protein
MSALVAGSVTYTLQNNAVKDESGRRKQLVKIAFGDGALTYPTGGVPLSNLANQGWPNLIESLVISDAGSSGYVPRYDATNNKLMLFVSASHTHDLLLKNAAVADGATTRVNAGANLLGANTGGDLTVTGAGANGGVVTKAAVALAELASSVAPAAMSVYAYVIGY